MTVAINREEWLRALAEAEEPEDPTALTASQFGDLFGMNRNTARKRLLELVKLGKAQPTTKLVADSTGRKQRYPAFKLVKTAPVLVTKGKKR